MIALKNAALTSLPESVPGPEYERDGHRIGIVHFGVGGFHRAHQAMFVDRIMNAGAGHEWGICGVGVLESDRTMAEVMRQQDGLYTLVLKHADGTREPRVIGSITDYLFAPDDPNAVIERLAHPDTRIVSLTVTEGGYNFDQITGEFKSDDPAILRDLEPGAAPRTVFALITAGIRLRRERGIPAFTIMSCDNIPGNGDVARRMFASFADLIDPELAEWIRTAMSFPNSMVDRITPSTTDADRTELAEDFGITDGWPVVAESFVQWVLEDSFALGRPPFEMVGVQLVDDVEPYELMKLRLLNVSHQGLGYSGFLAGYHYVHEAAQDPAFARFLLQYMDDEASSTLRPVPGVDLTAYKHELIERFQNPYVRDTLARLCAEASDRIPKWLVPVVKELLADGRNVSHAAIIIASWARYAEAVDEAGVPIVLVDRLADRVHAAALRRSEDPLSFVRDQTLFGDLAANDAFTREYLAALESFHARGAHATIAAACGVTPERG